MKNINTSISIFVLTSMDSFSEYGLTFFTLMILKTANYLLSEHVLHLSWYFFTASILIKSLTSQENTKQWTWNRGILLKKLDLQSREMTVLRLSYVASWWQYIPDL